MIAPDRETLGLRWQALVHAPPEQKETLFHPHLRNGAPGDKHVSKVVPGTLAGMPPRPMAVADDDSPVVEPVRYGFRSFDRQWLIPDVRLINQPNPRLWELRSERQVFMTAPDDLSPSSGPAITVTAFVPDLHHYNGRGGRVFPLWRDESGVISNLPPNLCTVLSSRLGAPVSPEELAAYVVAVAAHPGYTTRFHEDLSTPGLRIPISADLDAFEEAVRIGRVVVWLHTFGERMADEPQGRVAGPPRLPPERRPRIDAGGAIPSSPELMPDSIGYDATARRLLVGTGAVENVTPAMWNYEVSGVQVLKHWFSYRKRNRQRPLIGNRRPPSPLGDIQLEHWLPEYTTELLNVLNVLGWLVELEPDQAALLDRICDGPLISVGDLRLAGAFEKTKPVRRVRPRQQGVRLL